MATCSLPEVWLVKMKRIFERRSGLDFSNLLENELFADLKIFVQDGPDTKVFCAHKAILAAASSYFCDVLTSDTKKEAVTLNERYDTVAAG